MLLLTGCVVAPAVVSPPPAPAPHVEAVPRSPGPTYVWVPGRYAIPVQPGSVWVPGDWQARPGGHIWVEGYWRLR